MIVAEQALQCWQAYSFLNAGDAGCVAKDMWRDFPPNVVSTIGDSLEDTLDCSGRHSDTVVKAQMGLQERRHARGEWNDPPLWILNRTDRLFVNHHPMNLPVDARRCDLAKL